MKIALYQINEIIVKGQTNIFHPEDVTQGSHVATTQGPDRNKAGPGTGRACY